MTRSDAEIIRRWLARLADVRVITPAESARLGAYAYAVDAVAGMPVGQAAGGSVSDGEQTGPASCPAALTARRRGRPRGVAVTPTIYRPGYDRDAAALALAMTLGAYVTRGRGATTDAALLAVALVDAGAITPAVELSAVHAAFAGVSAWMCRAVRYRPFVNAMARCRRRPAMYAPRAACLVSAFMRLYRAAVDMRQWHAVAPASHPANGDTIAPKNYVTISTRKK